LSVFDDWVEELSGSALIDYAVVCRAEMLECPRAGASATLALAAEVSYDRALIKLCIANGIEADARGFSHPGAERARLERNLVAAGIDLAAFGPQRAP
jgi:hypothetical protein